MLSLGGCILCNMTPSSLHSNLLLSHCLLLCFLTSLSPFDKEPHDCVGPTRESKLISVSQIFHLIPPAKLLLTYKLIFTSLGLSEQDPVTFEDTIQLPRVEDWGQRDDMQGRRRSLGFREKQTETKSRLLELTTHFHLHSFDKRLVAWPWHPHKVRALIIILLLMSKLSHKGHNPRA